MRASTSMPRAGAADVANDSPCADAASRPRRARIARDGVEARVDRAARARDGAGGTDAEDGRRTGGDGRGTASAQAGRRAARRRRKARSEGGESGVEPRADATARSERSEETTSRTTGRGTRGGSSAERWARERALARGTSRDPSVRLNVDEIRTLSDALQRLLTIERMEEELRDEEEAKRLELKATLGVVEALALHEREAKDAKARFEQALARRAGFGEDSTKMRAVMRQGKIARQKLVSANIELAAKVATDVFHTFSPMERRSISRQDMIHEGVTGLVRASEKFDPALVCAFSTYAYNCTKQAVTRGVLNNGRTIRVPEQVLYERREAHELSKRMEIELGRRPTLDEIAARSQKFSVDKLQLLVGIASQHPLSLDILGVGDEERDGDETGLSGTWENEMGSTDEITRTIELEFLRDDIKKTLNELSSDEAYVLKHRFGLVGGEFMTNAEIGSRIGKSAEGVRYIEKRALERLKSTPDFSDLAQHLKGDRHAAAKKLDIVDSNDGTERKSAPKKPKRTKVKASKPSKSAIDLVRSIDLA